MPNGPKPPRAVHELNAPGAFYVEREMCIVCRAPERAAPDLMGFFDDPDGSGRRSHCYFKRQPRTAAEVGRALEAIHVSCCGAVRYGGSDPAVVRELARRGDGDACDEPLEP
jgi:hypothetical protein